MTVTFDLINKMLNRLINKMLMRLINKMLNHKCYSSINGISNKCHYGKASPFSTKEISP